jgi:hypothetical protein
MSATLYDTIRKIVQQELARVRTAELAVVQAVHPADPDNYSCTVVLRDSDMVLKQVPLTTPRKGVAMVPDVGDLVLVQFIGGQINAPVITGSLYNDEDRPPKNAPSSTTTRWSRSTWAAARPRSASPVTAAFSSNRATRCRSRPAQTSRSKPVVN